MSALKKPVAALIGVVAMLLAGLFFAVTPATAAAPAASAPAAVAPAALAAPHQAPGYGGSTITITITITKNADGTTTVTVTISGFQPGEIVIIYIHSKPYKLGSTTANASGSISTPVTIPASFTGAHTIEAVGQSSGITASTPIQLGGGSTAGGSGSGGGLSSTGVAVVGIGALGVVLLAGGGLLLFVGRRRKLGEI